MVARLRSPQGHLQGDPRSSAWRRDKHCPTITRPMATSRGTVQTRADDADRQARVALGALMRDHGSAIYGYCARLVSDESLAADVHQQVFEQAFRDLGTLGDPKKARSWLFGIAHHRCLDAIKARRRQARRFTDDDGTVPEAAADQPEAWEQVDASRIAGALDACVENLSPESRTALLLRYQEGMTFEKMSSICREKPGTLQARVVRALPLLRRCLEAKGIVP